MAIHRRNGNFLFAIFCIWSITSTGICLNTGSDHEYRLVRDLMSRYNKQVRPTLNKFEPLNVTFGAALAQIINVDEKNQIITTNVWINQGWIDPKLRWEPTKYGNVSVIRLPYDSIWLPDIVLYNSAHITSEAVSTNVIVSHDGNVTWLSMVILKSSCSIMVKYFPFDTQNCSLDFSSWTFDAHTINLLIQGGRVGDTTNYMNNSEWDLIEYLQERKEVIFSCCPEPYIFIHNYIIIQRRPLFYIFNMVVPCVLITLVALLGFYMPSDSGEKISMGITTLLSMTVFLMIVADKMPPTSDDLPLIGLYYGITIAIVSFATAMTVFTLNIHHKGGRGYEIPLLVKKVFFGFFSKILFIHLYVDHMQASGNSVKKMQTAPQNDYYARYENSTFLNNGGFSLRLFRKFVPSAPSSGTGNDVSTADHAERHILRVLQKVYETIERNELRQTEQDRREVIRHEWQQLALIVDRLMLICFLVLTATISLALILPGYASQFDHGGKR